MKPDLGGGFPLRCFQRLSCPNLATQRCPWGTTGTPAVRSPRSSRTRGNSPQVSTPTADRDRTVSRRSKPSSRTALIGEQPNPWDLLQPQDAMSRHRGAKPSRRYGLLGKISLLSPGYLLSVERRRFHTLPPFLCNPLPLQEQVLSRNGGTPSPEVTVLICRVP